MKFDLYKLELESGNSGTRNFVETIEAADEDEARLAAMKAHTGTSMEAYEYFRTFYRLFEVGTMVSTGRIKFSSDLVNKMQAVECSGMSKAEKSAFNNL